MLKKFIVLVFIILFGLSTASVAKTDVLPILSGVGGDFSAVNEEGEVIEFRDYRGKVVILAFGYTNCADICPFTLGYLKRLYGALSKEDQHKVRVVFVTVDPEYDTPDHLKGFVEYFNKDFIGLSGSKTQVDYIVSLYQSHYKQLSVAEIPTQDIRRINPKKIAEGESDSASLFTHTVTIYLIDGKGNTRSLEYTGTPIDKFSDKIRLLINE